MPLQFRRGDDADRTSITPLSGEPLWIEDTQSLYVGDGTTAGGLLITGGGAAPATATYIVQTSDGTLTNEQALASLATGILKNTTTTGVLSIATGSDLPSHTHVLADVTDAGTIASQDANSVAITGGTLTDVTVETGTYSSRVNEAIMHAVRKASAGTIDKGDVVRITGSSGTHLQVELADASVEATSSGTIGIAATSITDSTTGYMMIAGELTGLSNVPTASFTNGQALWLSETTGEFTVTRPTQPAHGVFLGWVVNANNGSSGRIYVKVINGQELNELHDVLIASPAEQDLLSWDNTAQLWKNRTVANALPNDSVTYGKIQNVTATDRLLGRVTAGAGDIEEITCTAAGRALIDDADAAAQRTTLGLVAGGAGDIWVEKAGDTMTGNLLVTRGSTTSDSPLTVSVTHSYTSGVGTIAQLLGTVAPATNSTGEARGFYAVNNGNPPSGVTITSCFGSRIEGLRWGANQDGLVTNIIGVNAFGGILTSLSSSGAQASNSFGVQGVGAGATAVPAPATLTTVVGGNFRAIGANSAYSATTAIGVRVETPNTGNTITDDIGLDILTQNRGSGLNVGLRVAAPSGGTTTAAVQLSGTSGAASGILFSTDTNLYRSAANTLKTDDTFEAANVSGTNTGDQNVFQTIAVSGQSNVVADTTTDTLTLEAGSGITITTDASADKITIAATGGAGNVATDTIWDAAGDLAVGSGSDTAVRLGRGSAGQVLTVNSGGTDIEWKTPSAGGTKTLHKWTPLDNQPPSTAFATLDTRNSIAVLDFDHTTEESAVFVGIVPEGTTFASGANNAVIVRLFWTTAATSGDVRWGAQFDKFGSTEDVGAGSYDTAVEGTTAVGGTAGYPVFTQLTFTGADLDDLAAGDVFRLKVYRDATDAADTVNSNDAELIAVEMRLV